MTRNVLFVSFSCLVLLSFMIAPARAQEYTVTDLGAVSTTYPTSHGTGLSPSGQYVTGDANTNDYNRHMFRWTSAGGMVQTSNSSATNSGYGVNDSGHIAGQYFGTYAYPCYYNGSSIVSLSGTYSGCAYGINSANIMCGQGAWGYGTAFWGNPSGVISIGKLPTSTGPYDSSCAYALNENGKIVGSSAYSSSSTNKQHAFLWTPNTPNGSTGSMIDIHTGSYTESFAKAINNNDEITGYCWNSYGENNKRAFYRPASGSMQMLPGLTTPNADPGSEAVGINDSGLIVGSVGYLNDRGSGACFAAKWAGGQLQLLSDSIDLRSPWRLDEAAAINNKGQIVGTGKVNGYSHAFLLTPIANPTQSPTPHVDSTSPASVHAGSVLHVYGTGFTPGSVVCGLQPSFVFPQRMPTTYISETQIDVTIGAYTSTSVWVQNPRPGGGESNHVNITQVANNRPIATNDATTTPSNTARDIDVLANDSDPDGDPLSVVSAGWTSISDGKTQLGGTVSVVVVGGKTMVHYVPPAVAFGVDRFNYRITDPAGYTASANATVTIDDGSLPPMATPDSARTLKDNGVQIDVLANDTGADANDHLTITSGSDTAHGGSAYVSTWNGYQTFYYYPPTDFVGTDTFTYTISNTHGKFSTTTVTINVIAHWPPVAVDDTAQTCLVTPVNIDVLANDSDPDPEATLSLSSVGTPSNGTASVVTVADKQYAQYVPVAGFSGTDTFTYTVANSHSELNTATVTVTVLNDNAPVAGPDSAICLMNRSVDVDVLANDSDPDPGDAISITSGGITTSAGGYAGVAYGSDKQWYFYYPPTDFIGTDTFQYTIADSQGGTATGTVTIQVVEHLPPVAVDDTSQTSINAPVDIDVLGNDSDPDWNAISISSVGAPASGGTTSVITTEWGAQYITYQPAIGFVGTDTFTYTIANSYGIAATATARVDVTNGAPTATDDSARAALSTAVDIDVLANDSDPDPNDAISISSVGAPSNGTASIITGRDRQHISYQPAPGFSGTDTFTYTITDSGGMTATANVTVEVINDNAPVAIKDSATCLMNQYLDIDVMANDSDPDPGDTITIITGKVSTAAGGTAYLIGDAYDHQWYMYWPPKDFVGTDTFDYTITDSQGIASRATVTVQVVEHWLPVAVDDTAQTFKATPVNIDVLANDHDADGNTNLSISAVNPSSNGGTTSIVEVDGKQYAQYQPASGFSGTDTFTYTMADSYGGTAAATVTVDVINNTPPIAIKDSALCLTNQAADIYVLANDSDPDPGDTFSITSGDVGTSAGGNAWLMGDGATQWFYYWPPQGFTGTDTFEYTIADSQGATSTALVTVEVMEHLPPNAVNDSAVTLPNTSTIVDVLANDNDPDWNATVSISGLGAPASGGTASVIQVTGRQYVQYQPPVGFTGTDTFAYTIVNSYGVTATATVTATVPDTGNPVVAVPDFATCLQNSSVEIFVRANDSQPVPSDKIGISTYDTQTTQGGAVWVNAYEDGVQSLVYSPPAGFLGTDTFVYSIVDGQGARSIALVTIEVVEHLPPVAVDDSESTNAGHDVWLYPVDNDYDLNPWPNNTITITAVGNPSGGTLTCDPAWGGFILYQPNPGFVGADTFTYTITNDFGLTASATVTVNVANNPPIAAADKAFTLANQSLNVDVLANDGDPEGEPITITGSSVTTTQGGTASVQLDSETGKQTMLYSPPQDFLGTDTFDYTIADSHGATSTATVTVQVLDAWPAPVAVDDSYTIGVDQVLWTNVLQNDSNATGGMLQLVDVSQPAHGFAGAYGYLYYQPDLGFVGTDTFTYTVMNDHGLTATATVTVNIVAPNQPPVAVDDSATCLANQGTTIDVLANDSDPDAGDTTSILTVGEPTNGGTAAVINVDGKQQIRYESQSGYLRTDTFTYTVTDSHGLTSTATVTVIVGNGIAQPLCSLDLFRVAAGDKMRLTVDVKDDLGQVVSVTANGNAMQPMGADSVEWKAIVTAGNTLGRSSVDIVITDDKGQTLTAQADYEVDPVYGIATSSLLHPIMQDASNLFLFALCGKVEVINDTSFWLNDGGEAIQVRCNYGNHGLANGEMVRARGSFFYSGNLKCLNVAAAEHINKP